MARGFGSTFGTGTTDSIESSFTDHGTQRTYALWVYRNGNGGGGLGRMFDKRVSGAETELLFYGSVDNKIEYVRWRSTSRGHWTIVAPSAGAWHHIAVTYDAGSTSNDAVIYLNGVSQSVTEISAPSGSLTNNTDGYVLGNRKNDNARVWDGMLAEFAIWNTLLSAAEVKAVYQFSPGAVNRKNLVHYPRLLGRQSPEPDYFGRHNLTVTGATQATHPRVIYPGRRKTVFVPAAGGTFTGTAALTTSGATFSASATFAPGTKTATAALTTGTTAFTAAATFTAPVYTATAAPTIGGATFAAAATFTAPVYTATASLTTGTTAFAASATFVAPVYTATAALTTGGTEIAAVATFATDTYTATANLTTGTIAFAASATFTPPVYTASATLTTGTTAFAATATFVAPTYTATATLTAGGAEFAASATFAAGTKTATAALLVGAATFAATGTFVAPVYTATAALTVGGVEFAATVTTADVTVSPKILLTGAVQRSVEVAAISQHNVAGTGNTQRNVGLTGDRGANAL